MGSAMSTARVAPLKPGLECVICMETMDITVQVTTNCGHAYCTDCIGEWLEKSTTCPHCRTEIFTLMTPRMLLRETKMELKRAQDRAKVNDAREARQRKEREKAMNTMSTANMRAALQRIREEGFHHGVEPAAARTNYHARVQMRHRRRSRRRRMRVYGRHGNE